jgi:hypothetical protein
MWRQVTLVLPENMDEALREEARKFLLGSLPSNVAISASKPSTHFMFISFVFFLSLLCSY